MDNNEFNRRIRYALQLDDAETRRLIQLGGEAINLEQAAGFRCKDDEPGFLACPDNVLLAMLDGLMLDRRGPPPAGSTATTGETTAVNNTAINNNVVLKQLRIALALRSDDIYTLMVAGGGKIGKTEVGAFFRSPEARNYRRCGDQAARWFLSGLATQRAE